jgi:lysozyme
MKLTQEGLDLIKSFEGFSAHWYKCPANVWTVGFGHTAAAGPPSYEPNVAFTKTKALKILCDDLKQYEDAVRQSVRVELNDSQFSALVSFCYNVGPNAFKNSSVLRAVNEGRDDLVPSRLMLYTKAGGKVLSGLVRRRQAEGQMFTEGVEDEVVFPSTEIAPTYGKVSYQSSTNIAAGVSTVAMTTAGINEVVGNVQETVTIFGIDTKVIVTALLVAGVCAALWIIKERFYKSKYEGV